MQTRVVRSLLVLLATVVATLGLGAGAAFAAGEGIQGVLRNAGEPLAGVNLTVTGPSGFSATVTSGSDGRWTSPVAGPGDYKVALDTKTLPKGVTLRNPDRNPFAITVLEDQTKTVLFPMGVSTNTDVGTGEQALNRFADGIRFGLLLALASVGLSLIYGTTGLTNFAHGEMVTFGGLMAFWLNVGLDVPIIPATLLTIIGSAFFGYLMDTALWAPLRRRGTGLIAAMIVSIGLSIALRYFFLYLFSGNTKSYADTQGQKAIGPGSITLSLLDYISMGIAIVALLGMGYFLLYTRLGKATRAVADNPPLAAASGIDVDRTIRIVWLIGAGLAGLAGVLLGIAQQVSFQMGYQILLLIFAAVTLGGLGTAFGALVGSLVVGLVVEMSTLFIPTELKSVGALAILIVMLMVRPQGLLGRAQRIG